MQTLIDVATKREDCQEGSANAAAIGRLQGFKNEFAALKEDEITGPDEWHQFVCRVCAHELHRRSLTYVLPRPRALSQFAVI